MESNVRASCTTSPLDDGTEASKEGGRVGTAWLVLVVLWPPEDDEDEAVAAVFLEVVASAVMRVSL